MGDITVRRFRRIGAGAAAVAGLAHFIVGINGFATPSTTIDMFGSEAVYLIPTFFLILGSFQLLWAWVTLRYSDPLMIELGTLGFIGSIILYLVSLATPLPLGVKQQTLTTLSAVPFTVKFIEIAYIVSSIALARALARLTAPVAMAQTIK